MGTSRRCGLPYSWPLFLLRVILAYDLLACSLASGRYPHPYRGSLGRPRQRLASSTALENFQTDSPLVVCLSSIPSRLPLVRPVLNHLLNQSRPAEAIFLVLPWWSTREGSFYNIPSFLLEHGEYEGKVSLLRTSVDWGPATKFVPIIQELKTQGLEDARVIVVDDDQMYPWEMVEAYDRWSQSLPDSAFTLRGHKMLDQPTSWDRIAYGNIIHSYELAEVTCVDIITAVGSYMVRPRFFTPELWETLYIFEIHGNTSTRLKGARNADDIWISGMLARQGVSRSAIPGRLEQWDATQSQDAYFQRMTIQPWEGASGAYAETLALHGGSEADNNQLIDAFWDHWSCFGQLMTLPPCPQARDGTDQPFLHGVPCLRQSGSILIS
ncbi:hypothetical protein WJX74_006829 [Apatococcus lobatus]|uniref:Uncharacterized protein n=1 Tax=Apatococcus lobatus TaxID=904363 RepID=A0AAW1RFH6_9CHLO